MFTRTRGLAAVSAALLAIACGSKSPTSPSASGGQNPGTSAGSQPSYTVTSFINGVRTVGGTEGTQKPGSAPAAGNGPSATPAGNNSVINGGSNQIRVRGSSSFQTIYIFVGGVSGGVGGYWELRLPSATADTTIIITLGRQIPATTFDCVYAVASPSGAVGGYSAIQTQVLPAQTGDVQVSASWDAAADVDLHVVDPRGEEIYWGNTTTSSGGQLDLDSNAGCAIDGKNNENIRWPTGRAPSGTYTVRLDYWSNCGVSQTNYVVTVNNGGTTNTYTGNFTGSGSSGGAGSGRFITSFTRASSAALEELLAPALPKPPAAPKTKTLRR